MAGTEDDVDFESTKAAPFGEIIPNINNGDNNYYGEILPRFATGKKTTHSLFKENKLPANQSIKLKLVEVVAG